MRQLLDAPRDILDSNSSRLRRKPQQLCGISSQVLGLMSPRHLALLPCVISCVCRPKDSSLIQQGFDAPVTPSHLRLQVLVSHLRLQGLVSHVQGAKAEAELYIRKESELLQAKVVDLQLCLVENEKALASNKEGQAGLEKKLEDERWGSEGFLFSFGLIPLMEEGRNSGERMQARKHLLAFRWSWLKSKRPTRRWPATRRAGWGLSESRERSVRFLHLS
jgi:hypothetical protein